MQEGTLRGCHGFREKEHSLLTGVEKVPDGGENWPMVKRGDQEGEGIRLGRKNHQQSHREENDAKENKQIWGGEKKNRNFLTTLKKVVHILVTTISRLLKTMFRLRKNTCLGEVRIKNKTRKAGQVST